MATEAEVQEAAEDGALRAESPHQPTSYSFPKRPFGKEAFRRSFKPGWFARWKWLHYLEARDCVLCFSCLQAVGRGLVDEESGRLDSRFVRGGFANWRKASEKFDAHERSQLHAASVQKLSAQRDAPIGAGLSDAARQGQATARHVLELMFRTVRFLGQKGLPFRGDGGSRDGLLYELMLERTYDLPKEREWLLGRDNWLSDTVQNEVIQLYAWAIQDRIVSRAAGCPFYGLTADGTTDASGAEQFSLTLQYVDDGMKSHADFLGFYKAPDGSGETLFKCVRDVFLRLGIPIERLQGYCFDGAGNMSGRISGVQARLKELCPGSLFLHCANHSLDLVLQEAAREVRLMADAMAFVQGVAVVIRESAKRKELYRSMFGCDEDVVTLLALCPTRWCMRTVAIKRVCRAYKKILGTLEQLKEDKTLRGEARAKIAGLCKAALKARTYFGLLCCERLFEPCEAVARGLQSTGASALGALECTALLRKSLARLRDDALVDDMLRTVSGAQLDMPEEPPRRPRKTPARYRHTTRPEEGTEASPQDSWRREFYEALDLVTAELERRFDQQGMKVAAARERVLLEAAKKSQAAAGALDVDSLQLPVRFDRQRLGVQLGMLGDALGHASISTVQDIAANMAGLQPQTRTIFAETEDLVKLCLCLPVSAAASERTFSTLRRLKTFLRTTMTQRRLTHLALMHVHGDILEGVDVGGLMRRFISVNPERQATFGLS